MSGAFNPVVFVDPDSGEVLGTGYRQGTQPAAVVAGVANSAEHYAVGGVILAYTAEQKAAKANPPTYKAHWDNSLMDWVDDRTLDEVKADCWEAVKAAREAAFAVPLETPFGTFDTDPVGRANIQSAIALSDKALQLGQPGDVVFTLADNSRVTLTNMQLGQVGLMLGAQAQAAYDKAAQMREAINAATTRDDAQAASVW